MPQSPVEAKKKAGVLLPWCSRVPGLFPARRTFSLFYGGIREGGARCPEHCCGATPSCSKKKAWAVQAGVALLHYLPQPPSPKGSSSCRRIQARRAW